MKNDAYCGTWTRSPVRPARLPKVKSLVPTLGTPFVWQVDAPDGLVHDFHCPFVVHLGLFPCNCWSIRLGLYSLWYRRWLRWSKVRVNPGWWARHREAPPWPTAGYNSSGISTEFYIDGWDPYHLPQV